MYPRMRLGIHDSISLIPQKPKKVPPTPPRKKRSSDSVRSCPASRPSVAPRAPRTANSLVRLVARASIRFATFAQAIKRRSEEHTSELQSPDHLVSRLLLQKKKHYHSTISYTPHSVITTY